MTGRRARTDDGRDNGCAESAAQSGFKGSGSASRSGAYRTATCLPVSQCQVAAFEPLAALRPLSG